MSAVPCTRCSNWSRKGCTVPTGSEHFTPIDGPLPDCALADVCQHSGQAGGKCPPRRRGLVCVSALATHMPYDEALEHPLAFHASYYIASEDRSRNEIPLQ